MCGVLRCGRRADPFEIGSKHEVKSSKVDTCLVLLLPKILTVCNIRIVDYRIFYEPVYHKEWRPDING